MSQGTLSEKAFVLFCFENNITYAQKGRRKKTMSNNKNLLPQYEIEGFDPNESLTVVQEIDEQGQVKETLFMRFQESLAWFLTVYPEGCLTDVSWCKVNH